MPCHAKNSLLSSGAAAVDVASAASAAGGCGQCSSCEHCDCGDNCQCTETLCQCQASSLLNSISFQTFMAEWKIDMHCQSCVRMTQHVLGDRGVVQFHTKTACLVVDSEQEAHDITEDLLDVGLDATLLSITPQKTPPTTTTTTKSSSCRSQSKKKKDALTTSTTASHTSKSSSSSSSSSSRSSLMEKSSQRKQPQNVKQDPLATPTSIQGTTTTTTTSTTFTALANDDDEQLGFMSTDMEPFSTTSDTNTSTTPAATTTVTVVELVVGGMTCSMCSQAISHTLKALPGVSNVSVNLATNVVKVVLSSHPSNNTTNTNTNTNITTSLDIQDAIESVGYTVEKVLTDAAATADSNMQDLQNSQLRQVQQKKQAFLLSLIGALPISILTMILPHLPFSSTINTWLTSSITVHGHDFMRESILLAILATLVQFGSGWTFYVTARYNIQSGQLGMDVLVAVGTTASYGYAWMETCSGQMAHSFETSAVLISFVLLGKWMNSMAVRRTSEALTKLMQLQSKTALLVHPEDGRHEEVNVDQIHPGNVVKILRGASLPADGIVLEGEFTVDESMMTGESLPILKTPGSLILGGTVCTESNGALVQVTGVGSQTALAQIVQLVQEAQTRQVPIQSLADTISSIFVPFVCTLSVITYLVWYALCNTGVVPSEWYEKEGDATFSLMFGIACLVISCPCALGLATPTAVMVGTGVAAQYGVLMKGGETLEMASQVNAVVFDKTGTLTKGKPCITDFHVIMAKTKTDTTTNNNDNDNNHHGKDESNTTPTTTPTTTSTLSSLMTEKDLLWLFASLERNSEHPLANAVVTYATEQLDDDYLKNKPFVAPTAFLAKTGRGASGRIGPHQVAIGNRAFVRQFITSSSSLSSSQNNVSSAVETIMGQLEIQGKTAILAVVDHEIKVVMGIADELKSDAGATISYLREQLGIDVWMVTGDNARTANAISTRLGLPQNRVISEALPVAKVQQVKKLQRAGKIVCMVGDGINDSAALAQANVGISLGTGAEIAIEAADMVLVSRGHVQDVVTALDLSRVIFRRIKLNFVLSLIYNCLGIPVAAGVLYPWLQVRLPPTLAAVAMALSSLSVVSSSLALKLYKPPNLYGEPSMLQRVFRRMSSSTTRPTTSNTTTTTTTTTRPRRNAAAAAATAAQRDLSFRRTNHHNNNDNDLQEPLLANIITSHREGEQEDNNMEQGTNEQV